MLPSTRTPEGEPLRCGICGASSNVLTSHPPGDSVCPVCGSHAWLSLPNTFHGIRRITADEIRNRISALRRRRKTDTWLGMPLVAEATQEKLAAKAALAADIKISPASLARPEPAAHGGTLRRARRGEIRGAKQVSIVLVALWFVTFVFNYFMFTMTHNLPPLQCAGLSAIGACFGPLVGLGLVLLERLTEGFECSPRRGRSL